MSELIPRLSAIRTSDQVGRVFFLRYKYPTTYPSFYFIPIRVGRQMAQLRKAAATFACAALMVPMAAKAVEISSYSYFFSPPCSNIDHDLTGLLTEHTTNNNNTIFDNWRLPKNVPTQQHPPIRFQLELGQTRVVALTSVALHGEAVSIEQLAEPQTANLQFAKFSVLLDARSVRCRTVAVGTERVCFVATSQSGDRDTTCLTVEVTAPRHAADVDVPATNEKIWVHTTFARNGESTFLVEHIEDFPNNHLRIFDQTGAEIYKKHGYRNEWNGMVEGDKRIPVGTYIYWLEDGEGHSLAGYVEVI